MQPPARTMKIVFWHVRVKKQLYLQTKTYFDGTVKVIVEALSGVEAEHLNLKPEVRWQNTKRKVNNGKCLF